VPELLLSNLPKFIRILPIHLNVTIKNVSWPHFSWATLYSGPHGGVAVQATLKIPCHDDDDDD